MLGLPPLAGEMAQPKGAGSDLPRTLANLQKTPMTLMVSVCYISIVAIGETLPLAKRALRSAPCKKVRIDRATRGAQHLRVLSRSHKTLFA